MFKLIILSFILFAIVVVALFVREIKNAPVVDEKQPFLWDDYSALE